MENLICACIVITCTCIMYMTIMEVIDRIKILNEKRKEKKLKKLKQKAISKLKRSDK